MPPRPSTEDRLLHEIEHHRDLAAENPEETWGWDSPAGQLRADRRARLFVAYGRIAAGARVLELGCGTGEFTRRVATAGAQLVALDLSAELLARAGAKVGMGAHFVRGNGEALPFPDGAFDAVYGCSILHHLDVETALREVRRVLRPSGCLVFSEPNLLNPKVLLMFKCGALKPHFGTSQDEMALTCGFLHPSTPVSVIPAVASLAEGLERVPLVRMISGSLLIHAER